MALEAGGLLDDHAHDAGLLASVEALCEEGWDHEHGGLFRYTRPHGDPVGGPYEDLVRRTWHTKLWWVHSEACYTTALAAALHGASPEWARRVWDYTLATFPARDDGREWIQIRDRRGDPFDQVVALPVKDPYHVTRNLLQILELHGA